MKTQLLLIIACLGLLVPAVAQERSASRGPGTQMTWDALSTQLTSLNTQVSTTNAQMDQLVACGKKGMLYAVGKAGADANGCKSVSTPASLGTCYQRAGWAGVHVACNSGEVVTKICTSGQDSDCIAYAGTIMNTGRSTATEAQTGATKTSSQNAYTVITCCTMQ